MKFDLSNLAQVQKYKKAIYKRVPNVMRMFMIEAYRQVTISTPVDTGRARWGWNCSIGTPDYTIPAEEKYTWDANRANKSFTASELEKSDADSLHISNAVPYITELNEGKSTQAPARFVELSFANAVNKLKIYLSSKGWLVD